MPETFVRGGADPPMAAPVGPWLAAILATPHQPPPVPASQTLLFYTL